MTGQGRGFDWAAFGRGFRVMVPLWAGVVPFAVAYAVTARTNGLSVWETCLMSVTVFAGASQFAAAGQFVAGGVAGVASALALVGTTFVLNARHVLYGLSLSRQLPLSRLQRAVAAQFLTDEAYGMVLVAGPRDPGGLSLGFLLGAELSLFAAWNAATSNCSGMPTYIRPSTSVGSSPASASARSTAWPTTSCVVRPDAFDMSESPTPQIAT